MVGNQETDRLEFEVEEPVAADAPETDSGSVNPFAPDHESERVNEDEADQDDLDMEGEDFFISPEEFYEDCGCGFSTECLTTCAEEQYFIESRAPHYEKNEPEIEIESAESKEPVDEESVSALRSHDLNNSLDEEHDDAEIERSDDLEQDGPDRTCFIATAAYADPEHPDVKFLREFRDNWLIRRTWGRLFVQFYWFVGPTFARFVVPRPRLASVIKSILCLLIFLIEMTLKFRR